MTADKIESVGREIELSGFDLGALRDAIREILVQIQIFMGVRPGLLDAINPALGVVEGLKDERGPELPLVDEVARLFVVGIDSDVEPRDYLLRDPGIEVMVAFNGRVAIAHGRRRARGVGKFRYVGHRHEFRRRRCEVAGVGRVKRRALEKVVHSGNARTRLVRTRQSVIEVKAYAVIDGQLLYRRPLVLRVNAVDPGLESLVVDDCDRNS